MELLFPIVRFVIIFAPILFLASIGLLIVGHVASPKKIKNRQRLIKVGIAGIIIAIALFIFEVYSIYSLISWVQQP